MLKSAKLFGILSTAGTGVGVAWVYNKSLLINPKYRGSLLVRTFHTASAVFTSLSMNDPYAAKKHPELVASMNSEASTYDVWMNNFIFDPIMGPYMDDDRNPIRVYDTDSTASSFKSVGSPSRLKDNEAHKKILNANYVRYQREDGDIIITGTTDKDAYQTMRAYWRARD